MNETRERALGNETFARLLGRSTDSRDGDDFLKNWRENSGYHPTVLLTILLHLSCCFRGNFLELI